MAKTRVNLQNFLEKDILGSDEVYYQRPSSKSMSYPAIIYDLSTVSNVYADNTVYQRHKAYEVIVIDRNPDSEVVEKMLDVPLCRWIRRYKADNLYHDVFILYW